MAFLLPTLKRLGLYHPPADPMAVAPFEIASLGISHVNDLIPKVVAPDVVTFDHVSKSFGSKLVLDDINFTVPDLEEQGEFIAIIGQSGCGKSTVLRIIAGLEPHFPHTSGEITIQGRRLQKAGRDRGVVDQKYSLLPHLTVVKNIAFGLLMQKTMSKKDSLDLAREWMGKVGLAGYEDFYPHQLSGGQQQRVAIAATLILKPRIILMDEPFGALDPKTRRSVWKLLLELWREQNSTVFLVTHSMEEAVYLGDRIFRMSANPGRLVEILDVPRPDCSPDHMRSRPWFNDTIRELFARLEEETQAKGPLPCPRAVEPEEEPVVEETDLERAERREAMQAILDIAFEGEPPPTPEELEAVRCEWEDDEEIEDPPANPTVEVSEAAVEEVEKVPSSEIDIIEESDEDMESEAEEPASEEEKTC